MTTAPDTAADRITTVVVTQDRWSELQRSLPHHTGRVILVDNASRDGTLERVRSGFPDIEVIELSENRGAVARNAGVEAARTPYVAFADDDSWWEPGALDRAAECLDAHPRLGLVAARVLVGAEERLDPTCAAMAVSPLDPEPDLPGPSILGFVACGAVIRRRAFLESGGFDDVLQFGGEEERLALDLAAHGWGLAYVPELVAHHHPALGRDPVARAVRVARNRVLTALMRRPWPSVASIVRLTLAQGRPGARGVLQAGRRARRALQARRPLPARVERARRLLGP